MFKSPNTLRDNNVWEWRLPDWKWRRRTSSMRSLAWTVRASVYIGETGRCLQKRLTEHKGAVRRCDRKNGIATHVSDRDHRVNWEEVRVIQTEPFYQKRRVPEALWIKSHGTTSNLDCGLTVNPLWIALFNLLDLTIHLLIYTNFLSSHPVDNLATSHSTFPMSS